MKPKRQVFAIVTLGGLLVLACTGDDPVAVNGNPDGAEGGACFGNGSCSDGLLCSAGKTCVRADGGTTPEAGSTPDAQVPDGSTSEADVCPAPTGRSLNCPGAAGDACLYGTEICCAFDSPASCQAPGFTCLAGPAHACESSDDCVNADVCCMEPMNLPTVPPGTCPPNVPLKRSTCKASCAGAEIELCITGGQPCAGNQSCKGMNLVISSLAFAVGGCFTP